MSGVMAMILAGGEGTRLMPLTKPRSKPAVPFGGSYRLIDFVLNNFVNSGILRLFVITQYKSQSLYMHLKNGWTVSGIPGCFIDPIPAQMRTGKEWYQGTADAIYQNLTFIEDQYPDNVCVFGSDHIYKMDIRQMLNYHSANKADLTVSAIRLPAADCAGNFGVIEVDQSGRMIGFEEKPAVPKEIPGDPGYCLVSMGNYIFRTPVLANELRVDAEDQTSSHDFGKDIIPKLFPRGNVFVYDLSNNVIDGEPKEVYWRDVGSIDAYWDAHMDLLKDNAPFSLMNVKWALHTFYPPLPPAHFSDTAHNQSLVSQSLISAGCNLEGARISKSVLGFRCEVLDGADVEESVFIGDVKIGEGCRIRRAIIDRGVELAPGFTLGYDPEADRKLIDPDDNGGVGISSGGIIVIPKGMKLGFN
ncbi:MULTISPECIES: glucose-1-phosphate adenylyltransferase [unclassified Anaerobiospirillum]|uniref:glucose-1-phosphate adenylyltransferase n=1 Tax=unclassified Anaerobiospirillum TaxID=2647410 RepID=UPI001FF56A52|nr:MULTISPECIES: glucose-1-phosphate adenylyltransferase [unclassified Anaerobiospirillum]MCK0535936.1 glucose-1-phosphate adenylyltransferase [Anaerobiospirillum sp. NML120511]MCK0541133.1 glucose-1-phosphate adenylyltransferase [Anaerobiospirillum sp. NML02-A-032]